jgi:hypothetical protein
MTMFVREPDFLKNLIKRKLPDYFEGKLGLQEPMIKHAAGDVKRSI